MKVTQDAKGIFTMNGQCLKYYVSGELVGKRSAILLDPNSMKEVIIIPSW